ncbi:MAG: hypothetical protein ACPIOQ_16730 [Promethearchaeia archaeon]
MRKGNLNPCPITRRLEEPNAGSGVVCVARGKQAGENKIRAHIWDAGS